MSYLKGSAVCQWVSGCLLALLAGCSVGESTFLAGNLNGVNHTPAAINHFSVNGYGGANISAHGYGGGMCCAMLPRQWQPGLKLKVEWEADPNPNARLPALGSELYLAAYAKHEANYQQHSAIVDLPPYETEKLCSLKVHFLPCNQIKVATACMAYGQPGYPIKEPLEMKEPAVCPK
ncbi:DUF3304 domain-containing protein [Pseudomonas syringae]|uniref:DUF3304 domain-containing protein n=1 Tax=Pseudomonas syringae TaxID=317 RepID=UPI001F256EE4|nr:DUF3304 domain-containing protein [Pseudomonas syringae]GKQ43971.1 DUF3304 domain-containing protein [Pseudomonas syringae pv. theae]